MSYQILPAAVREYQTDPFHPKRGNKGAFIRPEKCPKLLANIPDDNNLDYLVVYEQAGLCVEPCEENDPYMAGYAVFWTEQRNTITFRDGHRSLAPEQIMEVDSVLASTREALTERLAIVRMNNAANISFHPEDFHPIIKERPDRQQIYAKLAKGGFRNLTQKVSNRMWSDPRLRAAFRAILNEELDALMGLPPQANIKSVEMNFDGPEGKGLVQLERSGYGPYIKVNGRTIALVDLFYLSEMGTPEDGAPGFPQISAYPNETDEAIARIRFHEDHVDILVDDSEPNSASYDPGERIWRFSIEAKGE